MNFLQRIAAANLSGIWQIRKRSFDDNAPGRWYVDDQCIDCGLCGNDVPDIFGEAPGYGHYRVHHQPATPEEWREAEEARERCPTEAIGNDRTL